ncbi:type II secretion system protein GspN [Pyxidicoccus fallax]|uniref:Type II secretion system protein GspN n=1 Tax=Pyxidicoccus fallax TaxID=394095 RepID=A0A848LUE0_9BACT|nr:type II secretion system protein GspN [Pyxidicoccus fallax]NMO21585.1 type II secretion system protein GspN [Pyxidicoccus fallax]NPC82832.1 type II secretion system protein GspN [Pyxidicoccus fallax]
MPPENKPARWKVVLGYAAFAVVAFILGLFVTFPYDAIRTRIVTEAAAQGLAVRIGSLRPGLGGVTATQVRLSKPPAPLSAETIAALASGEAKMLGAAELGEAVLIDSVSVRPALFPPGVAVSANAMGGSVDVAVGLLGDTKVRVDVDGLKPSGGNLPALTGLDMDGEVNATLALKLPKNGGQADLSQADGELTLDTQGLLIKGGKVAFPMGGGQAVPMDLPRVNLGALTGRIQFEKGLGTVQSLRLKSDELEAIATGTLKLGKKVEYSEPGMDVNIKLDPEFQKRLGLLGAGVTILPPDKKDPSFRAARLGGFLNRPTFLPRR